MENKETIAKLYNEYVSGYINPTRENLEASKRFSDALENFNKELSAEKREETNRIYEYMTEMIEEENKQVFVEGYSLGVKLTMEALYSRDRRDRLD